MVVLDAPPSLGRVQPDQRSAFMGQSNHAPGTMMPRAADSQSYLDAESRALLLGAPGRFIPAMIDPPEHVLAAPLPIRASGAGTSFRLIDLLCG